MGGGSEHFEAHCQLLEKTTPTQVCSISHVISPVAQADVGRAKTFMTSIKCTNPEPTCDQSFSLFEKQRCFAMENQIIIIMESFTRTFPITESSKCDPKIKTQCSLAFKKSIISIIFQL